MTQLPTFSLYLYSKTVFIWQFILRINLINTVRINETLFSHSFLLIQYIFYLKSLRTHNYIKKNTLNKR